MAKILDHDQIRQQLAGLIDWKLDDTAIKKEWKFKDFSGAMDFLNQVAAIAEKYNHHPEIYNVYNRVSLRYYTHDAGGLTDLDFSAARDIDQIKI